MPTLRWATINQKIDAQKIIITLICHFTFTFTLILPVINAYEIDTLNLFDMYASVFQTNSVLINS